MKNNVRYYRNKKHLTQSELGAMIGVGGQTIGNIENAKHKPRPSTLRKLAGALGVEIDQLFDESDDEKPAA